MRLRVYSRAYRPLILLAAVLTGCSTAPVRLGEVVPNASETTVSAIVSQPRSVRGKPVAVEGRLSRVCRHVGCWFYLADGGAEVYVDLDAGRRFVVPTGSAGRTGRVTGVVRVDGGEARIVASSVELR